MPDAGAAVDKINPTNISSSLLAWVYGGDKATESSSAALITTASGEVTFLERFTDAPRPRTRGESTGFDSVLRRVGSPLLIGGLPAPLGRTAFAGDRVLHQFWACDLRVISRVWDDQESGRIAHALTAQQFVNAVDSVDQCLHYNEGAFTLWDFSDASPFTSAVCGIDLVRVAQPILRERDYTADWRLELRVLKQVP